MQAKKKSNPNMPSYDSFNLWMQYLCDKIPLGFYVIHDGCVSAA